MSIEEVFREVPSCVPAAFPWRYEGMLKHDDFRSALAGNGITPDHYETVHWASDPRRS